VKSAVDSFPRLAAFGIDDSSEVSGAASRLRCVCVYVSERERERERERVRRWGMRGDCSVILTWRCMGECSQNVEDFG
jgi:hypothetical protein